MRSSRVATPEIAVQLGSAAGRLVNISATGALVRAPDASSLGLTCNLKFDTPDTTVALTVRVVRVEPTVPDTSRATRAGAEHLIGVVFTDCSSGARQAIARLCGTSSL